MAWTRRCGPMPSPCWRTTPPACWPKASSARPRSPDRGSGTGSRESDSCRAPRVDPARTSLPRRTSTGCSEATGCSTGGCATPSSSSRASSIPWSEHNQFVASEFSIEEGHIMDAGDLIMVSVDDPLVEPPSLFEGTLPTRFQDRAPRVQRLPDGSDVWEFNGHTIPNIGLNAVAGRPREEYGIEPTAFEEMRPGCFDVHERIKDMNAGGVLASMNFPSFPGFSARLFAACRDKELALAVLRAYNDWHIDEWCGSYPGRFIPMALPILWDPELCAHEVRRVAAKGCHSLTFTENPAALKYPSFHDPSWDPLWAALSDEQVVLSIHLGSSGQLAVTAPDAPVDVMITLQPMNICSAASDLLWSRVIKNFPDIRIALSEGGTGWIPYFLDRVDRTYEMHHKWTGQDFGAKLPSEVFREHFLTCFISDPIGMQLRHQIGIDNIAWECDYPHSDSSWPHAPEELADVAAVVPDDEMEKITWANACRWYSFDPLAHRPRERCTVSALRSEAIGHDVSIRSYDQGRFERTGAGVDLDTIAAKATA